MELISRRGFVGAAVGTSMPTDSTASSPWESVPARHGGAAARLAGALGGHVGPRAPICQSTLSR